MQKQQGKAIALNPRGIWVLSQVVLPGKLGSWLAQAAQELTNPQVWITAPLPCVFSLRGKRLKIRTDTTLDLCDMECNCCLHCTSENSLHPTLLQMPMQQHYTYLLRQQVLPWSKTLLVVDDSAAGAPFGVPLLAVSLRRVTKFHLLKD